MGRPPVVFWTSFIIGFHISGDEHGQYRDTSSDLITIVDGDEQHHVPENHLTNACVVMVSCIVLIYIILIIGVIIFVMYPNQWPFQESSNNSKIWYTKIK